MEKHMKKLQRDKRITFPYLVAYPVLIYVMLFLILPILYLLFLSLSSTDQFSKVSIFKGLNNYQILFQDKLFWLALKQTFILVGIKVSAVVPLSLLIAMGINNIKSPLLRNYYSIAYFSPVITSTTAVALIWMWIYDPTFGFANYILSLFGIPSQSFLLNTRISLLSIAIVSIWKDVGWYMIIFFAGLQGIPDHIYEAGEIDGANMWSRFRYITLPLLSPTFLLVMVVVMINALREFTSIFVMTRSTISGEPGGPANSTLTLSVYMFKNAFLYNKYGISAAIAFILLIIIAIFTIVQFRAYRTKWEY
jgi:ABC-type sugar transport system permease subunit